VVSTSTETAQPVELLERQAPERDEHRVQPRGVVALRGEVAVALAQDLEMQPGDDVDRGEARADVARAGAGDHVQHVEAAGVGEDRRAVGWVGVEDPQALELLERHVAQGGGLPGPGDASLHA
jgi:hypothetical protein